MDFCSFKKNHIILPPYPKATNNLIKVCKIRHTHKQVPSLYNLVFMQVHVHLCVCVTLHLLYYQS